MLSPRPMAPSSVDTGDLGGETHAACAVDAAGHVVLTNGPMFLSDDRALVLAIARMVEAVAHGLVLKVAFAALVADRAVKRVIDQQEFHDPLARLLDAVGVGTHDHPSPAGMAHEATGFGARSMSTRHIRQLPAIDRRS